VAIKADGSVREHWRKSRLGGTNQLLQGRGQCGTTPLSVAKCGGGSKKVGVTTGNGGTRNRNQVKNAGVCHQKKQGRRPKKGKKHNVHWWEFVLITTMGFWLSLKDNAAEENITRGTWSGHRVPTVQAIVCERVGVRTGRGNGGKVKNGEKDGFACERGTEGRHRGGGVLGF